MYHYWLYKRHTEKKYVNFTFKTGKRYLTTLSRTFGAFLRTISFKQEKKTEIQSKNESNARKTGNHVLSINDVIELLPTIFIRIIFFTQSPVRNKN